MKKFVLICLLGGMVLTAKNALATTGSFVRTCWHEASLDDSDQKCWIGSIVGRIAHECALEQAMSECLQTEDAFCVRASSSYRLIMSLDPIGYKACEVTVSVINYND